MSYPIYKLAYIGAGVDTFPITQFPYVRTFIFVDTLPRCEFDDYYLEERFNKKWNHPHFITYIKDEMEKIGLKQVSEKVLKTYSHINNLHNPTLLTFSNGKQIVKYYVSTNFSKDHICELTEDLANCNGLVLSGYFPHYSIIESLKEAKVLIAMEGSCYIPYDATQMDDNDKENIVCYLHENPDKSRFNTFIFCRCNGSMLTGKNMADVDRISQLNS